MKISVILLAGGRGERMGTALPKQFLSLQSKPILHYSLEVLLQLKEVDEVIVVCAPHYRSFVENFPVRCASAGEQRQDSVYNGLQMVKPDAQWVCIHDGARPFIEADRVRVLFQEAQKTGAASLAMPVKNTLKEVEERQTVVRTLDRARIWEIQTPQILKKEILQEGFAYIKTHGLQVTDDVSLAELIGHPVKLVLGSYQNIKITTIEDLGFAEWFIQKNTACASLTMEPATVAGKSSPMAFPSKG